MANMFDAGQPLLPKEWSWDADIDAIIARLADDDFIFDGATVLATTSATNAHPSVSSEWRPVNESNTTRAWLPSEAVASHQNRSANDVAFASAMHYRYKAPSCQQDNDFHIGDYVAERLPHLELDGLCNMKAWLPVEAAHHSRSADIAEVTGNTFLQHIDSPSQNNAHNFNMCKHIAECHSHSALTGSCNMNAWLPALVAQQSTPADMAAATSAIFLQNNTISEFRKAQDCGTCDQVTERLHCSVLSESCKINALVPTEKVSSKQISSAEMALPASHPCNYNEPPSSNANDFSDQISEHVQHAEFDESWKIDRSCPAESVRSKSFARATTPSQIVNMGDHATDHLQHSELDGSWKIKSLKTTKTVRSQHRRSAGIAAASVVYGDPSARKARDISCSINENPLHSEPITPSSNDVIFGKGGRLKHPGNKMFRTECERLAPRFLEEPSTKVKRQLAVELVFYVFDQGGRFLIEDHNNKGTWKIAEIDLACKKARQLLADSKKKTDLRHRARD